MMPYVWVALGSALGGVARYGFGLLAARMWGDSFPWGTVAINVLGSFVIGFFGALTTPDGPMPAHPNLRIFVMVGICGGFTTFSSFSLQTFSLARDGSWLPAMSNVALSVILCLLAVTAGSLAADWIGVLRSEASAVSHTILAILDRPDTAPAVLAAASLAAGRLGETRIEALHVRHDSLEGFMPTEQVMTEPTGQAARRSADLRAIFDRWQAQGNNRSWRELSGDAARVVADAAAKADLIVIGHGQQPLDANRALHVALSEARLTTLWVGTAVPASLGRNVAIAWKPSDAADRAVQAAMPLLKQAERVCLLVEAGNDAHDLLERLIARGVPAHIERFDAEARSTAEALLDQAHRAGADLLVMGAYTHSRLAEFVLGGVTREVLATADLPVLLHH